jgi:hypothetical protein
MASGSGLWFVGLSEGCQNRGMIDSGFRVFVEQGRAKSTNYVIPRSTNCD